MTNQKANDKEFNADNAEKFAYFVNLNVRKWSAVGKSESVVIKDDYNKNHVWGTQDLISDKTLLKNMTAVRDKARNFLNGVRIPHPAEATYLVPEFKVEETNTFLDECKAEYYALVEEFLNNFNQLKNRFQSDNPELAITANYPSEYTMRSKFCFEWTIRLNAPPRGLPTGIQKAEMDKFKQEVEQIKIDTKNLIADEILKRVETLTTQFTDDKVNNGTIKSINNFLDKVDTLFSGFYTQKQLDVVLSDIRKYLDGVNADDIRANDRLKVDLQKGLSEAVNQIEAMPDLQLSNTRKNRAIDIV